MVGGKRVNAGLDIGKVLLEKESHIRIEASAVRHGRMGEGARPRFSIILAPHLLRQPAYGEAMPDIPSDARQLAGAVGDAGGKAGKRAAHASLPGRSWGRSQHRAGK